MTAAAAEDHANSCKYASSISGLETPMLRAALIILAAGALTGCNRTYYQDVTAAQHSPDVAYGNRGVLFSPLLSGFAPAPLPPVTRPVFTVGP
jgi:hypothetical protein